MFYCRKSRTGFTITDTKLYLPAALLSTQYNVKLFKKKTESDFERTIN